MSSAPESLKDRQLSLEFLNSVFVIFCDQSGLYFMRYLCVMHKLLRGTTRRGVLLKRGDY